MQLNVTVDEQESKILMLFLKGTHVLEVAMMSVVRTTANLMTKVATVTPYAISTKTVVKI